MMQGLRVLLVDDNVPHGRFLQRVMRREGCEVRLVDSGEAALVELADFQPQLVITDLMLPRMSGLMLAQHITTDPATRRTQVIAITASDVVEIGPAAQAAGCVACAQKPITAEHLLRLLRLEMGLAA